MMDVQLVGSRVHRRIQKRGSEQYAQARVAGPPPALSALDAGHDSFAQAACS